MSFSSSATVAISPSSSGRSPFWIVILHRNSMAGRLKGSLLVEAGREGLFGGEEGRIGQGDGCLVCLHIPPYRPRLPSCLTPRPRPIVGPSISPSRHICSRNAKVVGLLCRDLCSMEARGAPCSWLSRHPAPRSLTPRLADKRQDGGANFSPACPVPALAVDSGYYVCGPSCEADLPWH